jgi:hypothetical protein
LEEAMSTVSVKSGCAPVYGPSYREVSRLIGMDWDEYLDGLLKYDQECREYEGRRLRKAFTLAPNLLVCRELLRGERIPWQALDYFGGERYGLRQENPDGRYALDDFNDVPRP